MFTCYGDFWLMKATANTTYLLKMTNMGSGRVETETVTSNSEGFVVLTTDWSNYFNTVSQVKFQLFEMSGSTFNIPVSFSVITGFSGGSYASQDATVSSNLYDCIYTSFEFGEVDKQYLFNVNA